MAIWAFVLACCSILLSALTAIPAIILGIIALTGRRAGKGLAIAALIIAPVLIAAQVAILVPALANAREMARRSVCRSNLHFVGAALRMYASDYRDQQPANLDLLIRHEIPVETLRCPSAAEQTDPNRRDYFYMPLTPMSDASAMNACEFRGNHNDGRNVLIGDGAILWVREPEFQQMLRRPENAKFAVVLEEAQRQRR
jgi:hypothetical protein